MKLQEFERVLVDGGGALRAFGRHEYCVVVDSRDDGEAILRSVQRHLPNGYWRFRAFDESRFAVEKGEGTYYVDILEGMDPELILQSINRVLSPEFEMKIFLPTLGDTMSLLLRSADWWNELEVEYPARLGKLFVTIDERIRQLKKAGGQ
ncbi:hypothetical protein CfE428DRAFT_5694 [Chthoniobacter flavus Ellin428]|uniref:Uncharacterized protein n=1 Tax=Chthoniobacter flavus Ellin428 TaxID=497964 RepID=B4D9X7_9BACT|nr:hypothetical protein [Chthoniobacter flavus]EDY16731.1 hypothetical protein CfE428DRAFT_5694 [Chthoniobacter flavus Ellin428]TCO87848.1 hypothetical protein EV701_120147 [Chthoniobacter flavus]